MNGGGPSRAMMPGRAGKQDERPSALPLASGEPATVARLLVGTFPPKEAPQRARAMLADLQRLLPRHDWERHLRSAMRSELGIEPKDWMEAGQGASPKRVLRLRVAKPAARAAPARVGPSKSVANLSQDLGRILAEEQLRQRAPPGMEKCPVCGAAVEPMRTRRVRTHDNPLTGARCEGSQRPKDGGGAAKGR